VPPARLQKTLAIVKSSRALTNDQKLRRRNCRPVPKRRCDANPQTGQKVDRLRRDAGRNELARQTPSCSGCGRLSRSRASPPRGDNISSASAPARAPQSPIGGPSVSRASRARVRRHLQLSLRPVPRRHELARRAGAAPGHRHPQDVRRCNRAARGAQSQQVLTSVLRTADQRGLDATAILTTLLTAATPTVPLPFRTVPAVH